MEQPTQRIVPVNLMRTVAIFLVIVVHAAAEPTLINQISTTQQWMWWTANIYDSIARLSVPLFILVSGFLLLQPSKINEPTAAFYKKRLVRIAPPMLFWAAIYFVWSFFINRDIPSLTPTWQNLSFGYPYYHFAFLYMLLGLYLITPLLRKIVTYSNPRKLQFSVFLCFLSSSVILLICLVSPLNWNPGLLLFGGWVGYFLLGTYLSKLHIRMRFSFLMLLVGFVWTAFGTWALTTANGRLNEILFEFESLNVVLMTVGAFLLLSNLSPQLLHRRFPKTNVLIDIIGQNTLAIYLFHIIVLETLQRGLLGFQLSVTTLNPLLEIPLISALTLAICLAIVVPLKRLPILNTFMG